jgi:hypothetical protein
MPFEDVAFVRFSNVQKPPTISYRGVKSKKGGRTTNVNLIVGIPAWKVKDAFPSSSVPKKAKFVLQIDVERKRIRIVIASSDHKGAGVEPTILKGGALTFRFGYIPMLGEESATQEDIKFMSTLPGVGFEFDAPSWFKKDEEDAKDKSYLDMRRRA